MNVAQSCSAMSSLVFHCVPIGTFVLINDTWTQEGNWVSLMTRLFFYVGKSQDQASPRTFSGLSTW